MNFIHKFYQKNFSIRTFKPHHEIDTAAVRVWAKFQIASSNESEDISYLASVPNFSDKHKIREFSVKQFELQTPISQLFNVLNRQYFACELFSERF